MGDIRTHFESILQELGEAPKRISAAESDLLLEAILKADHLFVSGAGRSGLMAKAFAMRMNHLGFHAFVIGETVTPGFKKEDLLILSSGSGETKSLIAMAIKAKEIGGKVGLVTLNPTSTLGKLAELKVILPGSPKDQANNRESLQPMGSLYEQTLLLFYDALVLGLMEKKGLTSSQMFGRHANLE